MSDERAELFGGAVLAVERGEDPFAFHLHECGIPAAILRTTARVQPAMTSTTMAAGSSPRPALSRQPPTSAVMRADRSRGSQEACQPCHFLVEIALEPSPMRDFEHAERTAKGQIVRVGHQRAA